MIRFETYVLWAVAVLGLLIIFVSCGAAEAVAWGAA